MKDNTIKRYLTQFEQCLNSGLTFEEYVKVGCKHRHDISKLKNSLELIDLDDDEKEKYKNLCEIEIKKKPKYIKAPEETFKLRKTLNSINRLKSKRLKLGYRLQLASGLRVAEIANLTLDNIWLEDGKMYVEVLNGKGGKDRIVECLKDDYVENKLLELKPKKNNKLFCTENYIINTANRLNFHTHDLRKSFAQITYYNDDSPSQEKIKNLQDRLGHSYNTSTWKKYVHRDINLYYTKYDF
jgi:integrase